MSYEAKEFLRFMLIILWGLSILGFTWLFGGFPL